MLSISFTFSSPFAGICSHLVNLPYSRYNLQPPNYCPIESASALNAYLGRTSSKGSPHEVVKGFQFLAGQPVPTTHQNLPQFLLQIEELQDGLIEQPDSGFDGFEGEPHDGGDEVVVACYCYGWVFYDLFENLLAVAVEDETLDDFLLLVVGLLGLWHLVVFQKGLSTVKIKLSSIFQLGVLTQVFKAMGVAKGGDVAGSAVQQSDGLDWGGVFRTFGGRGDGI
jgi:hypothetical protein